MSNILKHAINKLPLTKTQKKRLTNNAGNNLKKVTWKELKDLRDNSQLVPGCWYRMTDYECVIHNMEYISAGHQFDLILLATDVNKLSEECKACRHYGDTYFPEDTNFESWELKYCLDNDTKRFNWAEKEAHKAIVDIDIDFSAMGGVKWKAKDTVFPLVSENDTTIEGFPYKTAATLLGYELYAWFNAIEGDIIYGYILFPSFIMPEGVPNPIGPLPFYNARDLGICKEGKGTIYSLKDHNNNLAGYDFKNILIRTMKLDNDVLLEYYNNNNNSFVKRFTPDVFSKISIFASSNINVEEFKTTEFKYLYTFSLVNDDTDTIIDYSTHTNKCFNNNLGDNASFIPYNVFALNATRIAKNSGIIANNTLISNIFGESGFNVFNDIINWCYFGIGSYNNTIFGELYNLKFNNYFDHNIICGPFSQAVEAGTSFSFNHIKGDIQNNIFGSFFANNITENYIKYCIIGNNVQHCVFKGNSATGSIHRSNIGNLVSHCTFEVCVGPNCTIKNDVQWTNFNKDLTSSVIDRIIGSEANPIVIDVSLVNKVLKRNSQGKIVAYNPADLAPESAIIE